MNELPPHHDKQKLFLFFLLFILIGGLFISLLFRIFYRPEISSTSTANFEISPNPNALATALILTRQSPLVATFPNEEVTPKIGNTPASAYYVSLDGDDTNPGTLDQPWKNLNYAAAQLNPGDKLFIRGGTYRGQFRIENGGTAEAPIEISNYNGEEVIIDGEKNTLPSINQGSPLVSVLGNWVILENITVQYSGDMGVYAKGEHVTLDSLYVHHNRAHGVILTGNFDLLQNSRIWYNSTMNENGTSTTGNASGASCGRYPDYCTIQNSVVWDNWGEGITAFEAMHVLIEGNISYDNQQNYYISDTKYTTMKGNIAYCSTGNAIDSYETQNGILVGDEKGVPIPLVEEGVRNNSSNNTFINNIVIGCNHNLAVSTNQSSNNLYAFNTFVNSAGSISEKFNVIFFSGKAENSRFVNNIIVQGDNRSLISFSGEGITFSNNLWSRKPPANVKGPGDIIGDPIFSKNGPPYSAEWFMLLNDSPARNKATAILEVNDDFFGNARSQTPDIGAIQFSSQ